MRRWDLVAAPILAIGLLIGWLYTTAPLHSYGVHWRQNQDGQLGAFAIELENRGRWPLVLTGITVNGQLRGSATALANHTSGHTAANEALLNEPIPQLQTGAVAGWRMDASSPPGGYGVRIDWAPEAELPRSAVIHYRYLGLPMRLKVNPMLLNWTPSEPVQPISLSVEPESGPPGTEVTVRIRLKNPEQAWAGGDGKSWNFQLCWGTCGPHQWDQAVWPKPSPTDRHLFIGTVKVPAYMNGQRLRVGPVDLLLACTTAPTEDCLSRPEAMATFRVTEELSAFTWDGAPSRTFKPVPSLDRTPTLAALDPANPAREVRCESGSPNPDAPDQPHLRVTKDGWQSWETVSLKGVHLGAMAGISGCRTVALDPVAPDSFYVAGGGHRGASSGEGRFPAPAFTADGGHTWGRVPAPEGYQPVDFLGFTTTRESVTAWFAQPDSDGAPVSFAGSRTSDGGRTWETVPLECPSSGPCVWEVPTVLYSRLERGLIRSDDGGKNWSWAQWQGARLQAMNRGFPMFYLAGEAIEVFLAGKRYDSPLAYAPLLRSPDGGKTWTWVDLPVPPGGWTRDPDLQMDSDGALRYRNDQEIRFQLRRHVGATWESEVK